MSPPGRRFWNDCCKPGSPEGDEPMHDETAFVTALFLDPGQITVKGIEALAASNSLQRLQRLSLSENQLGTEGAEALASASRG